MVRLYFRFRLNPENFPVYVNSAIYQIGRISAYLLIGLFFGLLTEGIAFAGFQQALNLVLIIAVLLFIVLGINPDSTLAQWKIYQKVKHALAGAIKTALEKGGLSSYGAIGFLNGLLPCGLVYLAVAGALGAGSLKSSALFMLFFGLGTTPMMMAASMTGPWLRKKMGWSIQKIIPVSGLILVLALLWRTYAVTVPRGLEFFEQMDRHIMCHPF